MNKKELIKKLQRKKKKITIPKRSNWVLDTLKYKKEGFNEGIDTAIKVIKNG